MQSFLKTKGPGLLVMLALALLAIILSRMIGSLGSATLGLLLGLLAGNSFKLNRSFQEGIDFSEKRLLEAAIVLFGFGLSLQILSSLGVGTWIFIGISVVVVFAAALLIGKLLKLSSQLSLLIGAGTAICGTSAIASVSPLINGKREETALSIGLINVLGSIGLLILPPLSFVISPGEEGTSLLLGGVLQSMGHVAGAAFSINENVGQLATIIKMGRILWIIPLITAVFLLKRKATPTRPASGFPVFILLFILAIFTAQLPFFPQKLSGFLSETGDYLLVMAMAAIGFNIRIKALFQKAGPALFAASLTFIFQIILFSLYIHL